MHKCFSSNAFCREGRLALVTVWNERVKTGITRQITLIKIFYNIVVKAAALTSKCCGKPWFVGS